MNGHKLARKCNEHDETALYWTDGKKVYFRLYEIKGADIETFEQFPGCWAKDKKHCYSGATRLQNSDPTTFEVLNFTYAKDKTNVWTLGGRIPDADPLTFEVCDSGRHSLGPKFKWTPDGKSPDRQKIWYESFVPYGYGKDKNSVYYYDFDGKPVVVKKATPSSFRSLGDGYFGYDEKFVFCGHATIPKANPATWGRLREGYYYSKDQGRIYYFNRLIKDADVETFEVVVVPVATGTPLQLAKDKNTGYWNDNPLPHAELEKKICEGLENYEQRKR
jgi:hypothetical protein